MTWVIDTCIVIDLFEDDPFFGLASVTLLEQRLSEGLCICPVTYLELAPALQGDWEEQENFLVQAGIDFRNAWTSADTKSAHRAWQLHTSARRSGTGAKRPIADVLIGAYACNRRGLITRNPDDFRKNFQDLVILEP